MSPGNVLDEARKSAEITHGNPEGVKGAQATAMCVWMLRNGRSKKDVERYVRDEYGPFPKFAPFSNPFDETCMNAVPVSVFCFLNSTDFEEAMYGVPDRDNPYKDGEKALFWDYEKTWLDMFVDESQTLIKYRDEYAKNGLLDLRAGMVCRQLSKPRFIAVTFIGRRNRQPGLKNATRNNI